MKLLTSKSDVVANVSTNRGVIKVLGVGFLIKDEYRNGDLIIPPVDEPYGLYTYDEAKKKGVYKVVFPNGEIEERPIEEEYGIRPTLKLENLNYSACKAQVGDTFEFIGLTWLIINVETALCDTVLGEDSIFVKEGRAIKTNSGALNRWYRAKLAA